ncbi:hypothetical protein DH09_16770 [Bacillaceae bacterium JMAK1]|nr:hypothetical protein DH09_16770 [Bacillaceae bacterium JMAK1]
MTLPICTYCQASFTWKQCIGRVDRNQCTECLGVNTLSKKSKMFIVLPYVVAFFIMIYLGFFTSLPGYFNGIFIVTFVFVNHVLFQPFLLHYTKEQDHSF